jgi:predicted secreted protein
MKTRIALLVIIVLLIIPAMSCIITSRDIHVEISCDDFMDHPTSILNEFEIEVGDKVYIELCSNPTTGFEWSYEMTGDVAIKQEDHDYHPADGDVPGAPGKEQWTFEGISSGTSEVLMEYSQPWEGGVKQDWIYKVTITVK